MSALLRRLDALFATDQTIIASDEGRIDKAAAFADRARNPINAIKFTALPLILVDPDDIDGNGAELAGRHGHSPWWGLDRGRSNKPDPLLQRGLTTAPIVF